jgi:GTP-binding protein
MTILPNSGPLSGKDPKSKHLTSQKIKARIYAEALSNVSLSHRPSATDSDGIDVYGRGAMQLGVLVENMRREGFEICISPPQVVTILASEQGRQGGAGGAGTASGSAGADGSSSSGSSSTTSTSSSSGSGGSSSSSSGGGSRGELRLEPFEDVWVEVDDEHAGSVIDKLTARKGEILGMNSALGRTQLQIVAPARAMFGFRSGFFSDTRGSGVLTTAFREYRPWAGAVSAQRKGALISTAAGLTTGYALSGIEPRGVLFIGAGEDVYAGQVCARSLTIPWLMAGALV